MSFPTRLDLFRKWAKAMEQGAKVDKPNYSPATPSGRGMNRPKRRARRPRRMRRMRRKKED